MQRGDRLFIGCQEAVDAEDRSGTRAPVEQELSSSQDPQGLSDLLWLFEAVALVEERAHTTVRVPESVSGQDAQALALVAQCIRDGGQEVTFRSMESVSVPDGPLLGAPNGKRFWDAVVVDGVHGETFGQ